MDRTGLVDASGALTAPAAGAGMPQDETARDHMPQDETARDHMPEDEAVVGLRAALAAVSAAQANEVRWVARVVGRARSEASERIAGLPADPAGAGELDVDVLAEHLAVDAVSCALGISRAAASRLATLAVRLTGVLPHVLHAWQAGILDGARARVLATATEVLDDDTARTVTRQVLTETGTAPWDGPSPRSWRSRVDRAVVRADAEAAARRRAAALAARSVRAWPDTDGMGVLQWRADASDVALAEQVITDLARTLPAADEHGQPRPMDQRRSDALTGLFHAVRQHSLNQYPTPDNHPTADSTPDSTPDSTADSTARSAAAAARPPDGAALPPAPRVPVRRVHDLGLVLHVDTLFGDGPATDDPARLRVLGPPAVLDPASARALARRRLQQRDAVQVLLVNPSGALQRVVRLDRHTAFDACRTRDTLHAAVRAALHGAPDLHTDAYHPTEAIARHVHADAPTCSFYDCPRPARACDLDHDTPWPRGPTCVTNLDPKCRRHHNAKTAQAVQTSLTAGPSVGPRQVTWQLPVGLHVTTTPEALPGCDPTRMACDGDDNPDDVDDTGCLTPTTPGA